MTWEVTQQLAVNTEGRRRRVVMCPTQDELSPSLTTVILLLLLTLQQQRLLLLLNLFDSLLFF